MRQTAGQTWTFDGWSVGYGIYAFDGHEVNKFSTATDEVRLHFGLKGDYKFYYNQFNKLFDLIGGHHNLMFSNGFDMELYNKSAEIETFGINFSPDRFNTFIQGITEPWSNFVDKINRGEPAIYSNRWGAVNSPIQQVINQIKHQSYSGKLLEAYLQAKALELITLCHTAFANQEYSPSVLKHPQDKEKIIAARDFIHQRLQNPPGLKEIMQHVGLNEYKLKCGFKETFQQTVYSYLNTQRLDLAHRLVKNTGKTVAEISEEMGYATPQHFNNAFKKHFGFAPLSVRKNS